IDAYKNYPIEIKGKTSLPRIPHDYHLAQLNIYLRWAESEYGYLYYVRLHERPKKVLDGIDFSKFPVVKGKNFKAFEIPYDEKLFKEAVKQFYVIKKHYERGVPPKGWNDYTCRFCPYYYICSGNGFRV
ncbi:CRISPR-associated protein Cas4, partial [Thermococci archaeon]